MAIFAIVVDEGSFRAAAKNLGLAPSRVSETVSDLEKFLNVTLLNRTTRKLALTNEGRKFYSHVVDITRNAEAGLNELQTLSQKHIGELKISLPAFLTSSVISNAIAKFALQNPQVSLSLSYTDQRMDMLDEGLDLSIRVGWLEDSSMMSRKIGQSKRLLVASKSYVAARPSPNHPSDLTDWDWIRFQMRTNTIEFTGTTGEKVTISENSRISANSANALSYFTGQHLGLTILPEHVVAEQLKTGEFVHVLPQWELKSMGYYAIWPDKSRRENLTLMLVRFLAEHCQ
ncbi:LysR family transcriptional regulator [Psychrosphaera algicola]|uniref:LysR family transcriptional regulator n=1 Tax=Psychrosphaera algicola TaxID=3023714 RepID=A0ABT5FAF9_9GAMM|nr:LysR family transcriptional regulator [Psychrosphaera sp. G1-22]MDC2887617.1 LysR family transcriptional regulator [Psychrosphaera sp. G1-22]